MPRGVGGVRDPRSVEWDPFMRPILAQAVRAHRQRKGVVVWVASPRAQFRHKDAGGRTAEERAFTRAAYWPVFGLPHKMGVPMVWSLYLTWGSQLESSSHGRRARAVRVRLYAKGDARPRREARGGSWADEVAATGDSSFQRRPETLGARQAPPPRLVS
jgi:hypothetical protein